MSLLRLVARIAPIAVQCARYKREKLNIARVLIVSVLSGLQKRGAKEGKERGREGWVCGCELHCRN